MSPRFGMIGGIDAWVAGQAIELIAAQREAGNDLRRAFADRLRELGCACALDDFGAGFGSFYYLKHLPFDYLKFDGEFVANCVRNETDRLVIAAVVDIARGMGKKTIAEFVTDEPTQRVVESLGVDHAQGDYVGTPGPLAALSGPAPRT